MLILHGTNCNLLKNSNGLFEIWRDGRRLFELLTEDEDEAKKLFKQFTGETWQPVEQ
jgi:hypothetical protein